MKLAKLRQYARDSAAGAAFAALSVAGLALFFLLPLAISLYYAFRDGGGIGLGNFARALGSEAFRVAFCNTFKELAVFFAALLALSLMIAFALKFLRATDPRLVFILLCIQLLPIAIPSSVTGIYISKLFGFNGVINGLIVSRGGAPVNFLGTDRAFWLLAGIYLWKNSGLAVLLFYARLCSLPKETNEAAQMEGAGALRRAVYITLPQLTSAFLFVVVISIWGVFKLSRESYIIFGSYPASSVYNLQNFLSNHFQSANYAVLSAASTVFFAAISLILLAGLLPGRRRAK